MIEEKLPLNIEFRNQQYVAVDYWWEDDDFVFITDKGDRFRFYFLYPTSMRFDGLDYDTAEDVMIETTLKYQTSNYVMPSQQQRKSFDAELVRQANEAESRF